MNFERRRMNGIDALSKVNIAERQIFRELNTGSAGTDRCRNTTSARRGSNCKIKHRIKSF